MDAECYLVQPNHLGKIKYLHLVVEGDTMTSYWGQLGGAEQETANTYDYINEGKSNELTPEEAALSDFQRKKDKKMKEGYKEVDSLDDAEAVAELDEMNFDSPPTSFAPSKPIKTISDPKLQKLINSQNAMMQVKENGLCHFIIVGSDSTVRIFTRRMDDHTSKYPALVKEADYMVANNLIGPKTMLMTEFIASGFEKHMAGFNWMQRISKSNTSKGVCLPSQEKALARQEEHPVRACVFHIPYLNGEKLWEDPFHAIYDEMTTIIDTKDSEDAIFIPELIKNLETPEEVDNFIRLNEGIIEGIVVWDGAAPIEIGFNGKPKRRAAYKYKSVYEDDVIAYDWMEGKGDHQNAIGALWIGKLDSKTDEMVKMGRVGSGLKDTEINPDDWEFPCVINIEYQQRFPDGPFQFPVFISKHGDKTPDEVTTEDDLIFGSAKGS
jgi:predicted DNA-binding WGR domain protein